MSWEASYSLDSSPLVFVDLPSVNRTPGAPRFGAEKHLDERDTSFETDDGSFWAYRNFSRNVWRLTFRVNETQLMVFRTMHDAVDGALTPFYFRLGTEVLYVRKESGFKPQMLTQPTSPEPVYDYTLTLTEELISEEF